MNVFEDLFLLQRIDHLIRTRATGTPDQLADRLNISERHVYRLVGKLRDQGLPIGYDKFKCTYYYSEPVALRFDIEVNGRKLLAIKGGEKKSGLFPALTIYGSDTLDIC